MPVKHIISPGVGFSPASVMYMVTRGLSISAGYFTWRGPAAFAGYRDSRKYTDNRDGRAFAGYRDNREHVDYTESRAFAGIKDNRSFNDD